MEYLFTKEHFNVAQLEQEIRNSTITKALESISSLGDQITVKFKDTLTEAELELLTTLIQNHIPQPVNNTTIITASPFDSKVLENNKRLFKRFIGVQYTLSQGENVLLYTIPYPWVKIDGIEIINCSILDKLDFEVLDSVNGNYSGIPNFKLNQFGFSVNLPEGFYSVRSKYDSDLYQGMQIMFKYFSSNQKTIGINLDLHEVK